MTRRRGSIGTVLALAACVSPGQAGAMPSQAEAVVTASKAATGGTAWDRLQGCEEHGTHDGGAVAYTTWFSLRRYGMRLESRREGATRTIGFDGEAGWRMDGASVAQRDTRPEGLREAITTAYLSNNGFHFPARFPATFRYLREAAHDERSFDVLEITPSGGRALDYWFDRNSHLLLRVVDNQGPRPVTVEASDYRRVGRIRVAFALTTRDADGAILDRGVLTSLRCGAVDPALFSPPHTP